MNKGTDHTRPAVSPDITLAEIEALFYQILVFGGQVVTERKPQVCAQEAMTLSRAEFRKMERIATDRKSLLDLFNRKVPIIDDALKAECLSARRLGLREESGLPWLQTVICNGNEDPEELPETLRDGSIALAQLLAFSQGARQKCGKMNLGNWIVRWELKLFNGLKSLVICFDAVVRPTRQHSGPSTFVQQHLPLTFAYEL